MQERELRISTDKHELDLSLIHRFLSQEAYWSQGVPQEVLRRAIEHSLCFGAFIGDAQVGFAPPMRPQTLTERLDPDIYQRSAAS